MLGEEEVMLIERRLLFKHRAKYVIELSKVV